MFLDCQGDIVVPGNAAGATFTHAVPTAIQKHKYKLTNIETQYKYTNTGNVAGATFTHAILNHNHKLPSSWLLINQLLMAQMGHGMA